MTAYCLFVFLVAIGAVAAAGAAAGTALEVIGGGEDDVLSFKVVVFGLEIRRRRWGLIPVHLLFSLGFYFLLKQRCVRDRRRQSVELKHDTYRA